MSGLSKVLLLLTLTAGAWALVLTVAFAIGAASRWLHGASIPGCAAVSGSTARSR